jgi:hypothetical protein
VYTKEKRSKDVISMEGWLMERSRRKDAWRRRWVRLTTETIQIFHDKARRVGDGTVRWARRQAHCRAQRRAR